MSLVPEWAPNLHPLVIHFPIVLVVVAAAVDAAALALRSRPVHSVAVALYAAAALGAIAAYRTGLDAIESVALPPEAIGLANSHADAGWLAMWVLIVFGTARVAALFFERTRRPIIHGGLAILGVACIVMIWLAAEQGAELVYVHGVGVAAVQAADPLATPAPTDSLVIAEDGSWHWAAGAGQTAPPEFEFRGLVAEPSEDGLELRSTNGSGWLLAGPPGTGHQLDVELDLSEWNGQIALVHHYIDEQSYDFFTIDDSEAVLGRMAGGTRRNFDRSDVSLEGRVQLRVVGQTTHFLGYVDGAMVVHGHGPAASAGRVGLRFDGSGIIRLHQINSTSL
jgi:uncharacterized membrane protein